MTTGSKFKTKAAVDHIVFHFWTYFDWAIGEQHFLHQILFTNGK